MSKTEIIKYLKSHQAVIQQFGVVKIGLFGSYAKDCNKSDSDIDLLVKFGEVQSKYKAYFGLKNYLEDHLKAKIDLCREEDLKEELKKEILESVIYG